MADDFARQLLDALYNPETQPPQQPSRPLREKLAGAAETAATLGSGLLASVPAGLAGLTQMIPTRGHRPSVNRAAQKVEDVQSALTYLPRTEAGQEYLEKTAGALGMLGAPAEFLGEQTLKLTGSPLLATAANVGLDPVNYIGIPGTGKAAAAATKATGRAIAAAPRVAGEMISDLAMPAPRAQAQRGAINLGPQIPEFQPQTALGLVSRADEALASLPRQRGTGAEFLRELEKTPGVRMAELEDRGLVEALSGMGKVTKADVIKALQDNPPVQLKEVMLGSESLTHRQKLAIEYDRAREESARVGGSTNPSYIERIPESNRTPEEQRLLEAWNRVDQALEESWLSENPPPKYGQYTLPGGENYREILLTLPGGKPSAETEARLRAVQDRINELRPIIDRQPLGVTAERKEFNNLYDERDRLIQEREGVNYKSGHWSEPNVLAHARISDRTGPNGEKILHVEEVQSDWHQTGRKEGYKTGKEKEQISALSKQYDELTSRRRQLLKQAEEMPDGGPEFASLIDESNSITPKLMRLQEQMDSLRSAGERGVPDAPFKKNWHELMMRRLVDYAAKNGYDRIAITPGAEQASRYDLSKHITDLSYKRNDDGTYRLTARDKDGRLRDLGPNNTESQLSNIVGKDIAEKIVKGEGEGYPEGSISQGFKKLSGLDLQVGGEGMKGFYDKILPTYLNELGKPYGVKVGQMDLSYTPTAKQAQQGAADEALLANLGVEVPQAKRPTLHTFDITPQMREAIKSKGLPLYAKGGSVHISDNPDTMRLELAGGGALSAAKAAAKAAEKAIPPKLPRAEPKTKAEIEAIAQRMAPQLTGEYVRKSPESAITVAGKTKRQFEREKDLPVKLTGEAPTPEQVGIESMKDKVAIGILGDPSITGRELESVGDIRLGLSSPQHGGPFYGMGDEEKFWASGKGAAQKVQNLAEEAGKQYDTDVLGKYIMMGPEGLNYALHFADANLQAIDTSKMTKRQIEEFNKLIRRGSPDSGPRPSFPGIEDKVDAYLQFAIDPKLRIHFNSLMQMPTVTEAFNLPSGQDIRFAITEPALRDLERGVAGMSIGQMRPGAELTQSLHPTYEMDIPGKFLGSSKYPIPYELMFPDTVKAIRSNPRQAPHEFGSLGMVGPRQIIDQQMIDEIKAYEEQIRKLTGKKKGGAVKKQAGGAIKAAVKAAKPTAEQAATMAAQRAELVLRSRAMQELKDQFEDMPQPPKGFLSPESILQRMDEIRRREATPSGEQIPLLKKGGGVEMQAGGALKAAAKAAAKAAETTKKVSTNAAPLTPLQSIQQGGYKIPPGGLSSEDKAALRPLYNQGLVKVEERGQEKFIVPGRGAWFEFATPEQKKALDQFQVAQNLKDLSFMGPTESLLNSAQASFYDFEISPGVRSIPIKMFEPFIGGYDSAHESKRIQDLTRAIQQSKQIEPLFVGLDPTGEPYIMEGQHRVRALKALGYDQIPARVVVDMDDITKAKGGAVSKRGKVSITDNLDTMRLAVQKRK